MADRYASTRAVGGRGKWFVVEVAVHEKILVEISDGEDESDAKEIALGESSLFRQTELEVQVDIEPVPDARECLEYEMRCAHQVIPMWDGDQGTGGGHND